MTYGSDDFGGSDEDSHYCSQTKVKGQRFLDRVAELDKLYPNDKDLPSVLATSKYPFDDLNMIKQDPVVENVLEFHRVFKCHIEDSPRIPAMTGPGIDALKEASRLIKKARLILREQGKANVNCCRVALIAEETAELADAYVENDLEAVLDAYCDIRYVVAGGVTNCGLQNVVVEGDDRVHTSNMSKTDENGEPIFDESGKIVKGPNYKPVDLSDLVDGSWLKAQEELEKF